MKELNIRLLVFTRDNNLLITSQGDATWMEILWGNVGDIKYLERNIRESIKYLKNKGLRKMEYSEIGKNYFSRCRVKRES